LSEQSPHVHLKIESRSPERENTITAGGQLVKRLAAWSLKHFSYRPFLLLLGFGALLRIVLMIAYFPAIMFWIDSIRHARIVPSEIFGDCWMPAGYAMWLALLRAVTHQLWFTIVVQHLLGLSVGAMLFLALRHLGITAWLASGAAAVPLLSGDHLYLEHVIMSESLFLFVTTAGLTAAIYGLAKRVNLGWLCAASALFGLAALIRNVGVLLLPILVVCTLAWVRKAQRTSLAGAFFASVFPGGAVVAIYCVSCAVAHGAYLGFADTGGWNLYARVAPFADCGKFSPPEGTAILCEETPPSKRPGSFGYSWDVNSTARRNFPYGQAGDKLGAFAIRSITRQPLDYVFAVLIDFARYIEPSIDGNRPYAGTPREIVSFGWRDFSVERIVVHELSKKYHKTKVRLRWQEWLGAYQNLFRVGGLVLAALICLTFVGMIHARGPMRMGIFLFGLVGLGFYLVPVMTLSYDFRYGIPAETFVVVSGVLSAAALRSPDTKRSG
jgi:hypothetical protein